MKVAVASSDFRKVTGHAGRARRFLVFEVMSDGQAGTPTGIELEPDLVFHHFKDDRAHPLDGVTALITLSAGESFVKKMAGRGVDAVQTAETDPAKAVRDYVAAKLAPPKPRPIGGLVCKTIDLLSRKE